MFVQRFSEKLVITKLLTKEAITLALIGDQSWAELREPHIFDVKYDPGSETINIYFKLLRKEK